VLIQRDSRSRFVCTSVCVYVSMCACMCCMYECMCVSHSVCIYIYVCMHACKYAFIYIMYLAVKYSEAVSLLEWVWSIFTKRPFPLLVQPSQPVLTFSKAGSKLKSQSSNVSFDSFQWKDAFDIWALSFERAFENVSTCEIGCTTGSLTNRKVVLSNQAVSHLNAGRTTKFAQVKSLRFSFFLSFFIFEDPT